jgi:hypothetical protein
MAIEVHGEPSGLYLERGEVSRANVQVIKRDDKGRPASAVSQSLEALKRLGRSMGKGPESMEISTVPATEQSTFRRKSPVICHEIEIAALKSGLLTFDQMLAGDLGRFTRSDLLAPVRSFVRSAVMDRKIDSTTLHLTSMGLQYEKLGLYQRLRKQIAVPKTPFEHFLIVASNLPARCLELVWIIFGFDPFGFRLCTQWTGEQFALAIINPVLRECTASGPHRLATFDELLCSPTKYRSTIDVDDEECDFEAITCRISEQRGNAYMEAVDLVESNCDSMLKARFVESAALSAASERSFRSQVTQRLVRIFGRRAESEVFIEAVNTVVAQRFRDPNSASLDVALPESIDADWQWPASLGLYRACLADLKLQFGLPGDWFSDPGQARPDPAADRLAGETLDRS